MCSTYLCVLIANTYFLCSTPPTHTHTRTNETPHSQGYLTKQLYFLIRSFIILLRGIMGQLHIIMKEGRGVVSPQAPLPKLTSLFSTSTSHLICFTDHMHQHMTNEASNKLPYFLRYSNSLCAIKVVWITHLTTYRASFSMMILWNPILLASCIPSRIAETFMDQGPPTLVLQSACVWSREPEWFLVLRHVIPSLLCTQKPTSRVTLIVFSSGGLDSTLPNHSFSSINCF